MWWGTLAFKVSVSKRRDQFLTWWQGFPWRRGFAERLMEQGFLPVTSWHLSIFRALLLSSHPSLGGLRNMKCLKWPILHQEVRKYYSLAVVTMATGWEEETTYLVQSRANWTFRDTSSYCSPETGGRTKDAHTSSQSNPPYSYTYHSYTGRDLSGKRKKIKKCISRFAIILHLCQLVKNV